MRTLINEIAVFVFIGCLAGALVNWFALRKGLTFGQSAWHGFDGSEASQRRLTAMRNFAICVAIGFVMVILLVIVDQ
jgi:hypothetical protein